MKPLAIMPIQSDHGDVHEIRIVHADGTSLTVAEYKMIFKAITGRKILGPEIPISWFAVEDR